MAELERDSGGPHHSGGWTLSEVDEGLTYDDVREALDAFGHSETVLLDWEGDNDFYQTAGGRGGRGDGGGGGRAPRGNNFDMHRPEGERWAGAIATKSAILRAAQTARRPDGTINQTRFVNRLMGWTRKAGATSVRTISFQRGKPKRLMR